MTTEENPDMKRKPAARKTVRRRNPAKRLTMADIRRRATAAGSHYFDRGNSKFFGGDRFWGPYTGEGGTYFVVSNNTGISVRPVERDHTIGYLPGKYSSAEDARVAAKAMAKRR